MKSTIKWYRFPIENFLHTLFYFIQVECKKAQPKEVMYAQQMAKGKAALQRGAYSDILSAYVYGLNRTIPATYAAPIYPFSPGRYFFIEFNNNPQ